MLEKREGVEKWGKEEGKIVVIVEKTQKSANIYNTSNQQITEDEGIFTEVTRVCC